MPRLCSNRSIIPNLLLYPGGPPQRPYDVTAHTLPLLFGVDVKFADRSVAAPDEPADLADPPSARSLQSFGHRRLEGREHIVGGRQSPSGAMKKATSPSLRSPAPAGMK